MCVSAVNWLPGSLSAMIPFFAINQRISKDTLYLRADDPNIYGIYPISVAQNPPIIKNGISSIANKGCNFYSAPWCISTFSSRDTGKRIKISNLDKSVYDYITSLYSIIGGNVTLTNWQFETEGYVKIYQILNGSQQNSVSGVSYFGGNAELDTQIAGVASTAPLVSNLISNDFTFNGLPITTYRMPYNTFCAVDSPIIISAIDSTHPESGRIYFTLKNSVAMNNSPPL